MAGQNTVRVEGLRELQRDFRKISRDLSRELRDALKEAAEPAREEAERLATEKGYGAKWSRIKTGVTVRGAYIAPAARRRGGSPRRNFGGLLWHVMDDAAEAKRPDIERSAERMLDRLTDENGL